MSYHKDLTTSKHEITCTFKNISYHRDLTSSKHEITLDFTSKYIFLVLFTSIIMRFNGSYNFDL